MKSSTTSSGAVRSSCGDSKRAGPCVFARTIAVIAFASSLFGCAAASQAAGLADSINSLRVRGCSGSRGAPEQLRQTRALDTVAKEWSKGGRLKQALERAEYRAANSSSMRLSGPPDDRAIINALAANYCGIVTNP